MTRLKLYVPVLVWVVLVTIVFAYSRRPGDYGQHQWHDHRPEWRGG